jgi:hypothetical protein
MLIGFLQQMNYYFLNYAIHHKLLFIKNLTVQRYDDAVVRPVNHQVHFVKLGLWKTPVNVKSLESKPQLNHRLQFFFTKAQFLTVCVLKLSGMCSTTLKT